MPELESEHKSSESEPLTNDKKKSEKRKRPPPSEETSNTEGRFVKKKRVTVRGELYEEPLPMNVETVVRNVQAMNISFFL
ncbi:hypothetical protein COOONC_05858 [Cooperia oncophora]